MLVSKDPKELMVLKSKIEKIRYESELLLTYFGEFENMDNT